MHHDMLKKAEAFVDKVVAPARRRQPVGARTIQAKTDLARKDLELGKAGLAGSGIDLQGLDKLAAERSKERRKLAELTRRNAVTASATAAARLRDMAPVIVPFEPMDTIIDQVTFIRTFADQGVILESNIGPSNNWARYKLQSTSDVWNGTGRLSFFILWKNDHDSPTVMTAKPNLIINAQLSCSGDWSGVASWFGMSSQASANVGLRMTVWGMDSSTSSVVYQQDNIAQASVDGGFFGGDSGTPIEFNQVLTGTGVVVPGQTYALIEVEVLSQWNANSDASVTFDAESGSHRIDLPQLILSTDDVLPPPPPITLTAGVDHFTTPPSVLLIWTGATTAQVDIYQNGVRTGNTLNDGAWSQKFSPGTYTFRICDEGSTVCSADVTVTVT
jgi:hypothetical protein